MYVNTNVAALNAWQNLYQTQQNMTNVLQQLSSGNRINSAANDPAGLAISQEMTSQIGGMTQANQNAQSAISLLQTSDSALGQIQNILQSMHSLASEAAGGTMNSNDTAALQAEMNQYAQEITSITNQTAFNTLNLLGGTFTNQSIQIGPDQGQTLAISMQAADAYSLGVTARTAQINATGDVANITSAVGMDVGGKYSLAANVTPWSVTGVTGSTSGLLTSLTGSSISLTTADSFSVTVTQAGSSTLNGVIQLYDQATGVTTSYTATAVGSSGTFNVNIDGNSFTLAANVGTQGNTFSATINPTSTVFTLSEAGGSSSTYQVYGALTTGTTESMTLGSASVTFTVASTLADTTNGSYIGGTGSSANISTLSNALTTSSAGEAGSIFSAEGLTSASYTLSATVTPWKLANLAGTTSDLISLVGGASMNLTSADSFSVSVVTAGAAGTNAVVDVYDAATGTTTAYTAAATGTTSAFTVTLNGQTFTLNMNTATTGDGLSATIDPTQTVFTLSQAGGTSSSTTVNGVVKSGATEVIDFGSGGVTFTTGSTLASETQAAYTASTGNTFAPTASSLTTTDFTVTGNSGGGIGSVAAATGMTSGTYTVSATVTPWSVGSLTGTTADLLQLSGSSINLTTADSFTVTVNTAGATGVTATISFYDAATGTTTAYTATASGTTGTFDVNLDGQTFTLQINAATTGDTVGATVNPSKTVFSITKPGGTTTSDTVYGAPASGTAESLAVGSGSLTVDVGSALATQLNAAYTANVANTFTPAAPSSLSDTVVNLTGQATAATLNNTAFAWTQTGAAAVGANGALTTEASATYALYIGTQANAAEALTILTSAINQISTERGNVGAYQNRLQFASSDLQTSSQNLQTARAGITNADMAMQMANLTKYQVLQQSGVAMLAQADQMPQALLKLLS